MTQTRNKNTVDTASEGYRAALQMIAYQGRLVWAVFGAMLAANGFVVALVGALAKFYPNLATLRQLLPWIGIALCVAWSLITVRHFGFYRYWFAWARYHEGIALKSTSGMIQDGKRFANGESVAIDQDEERLNWFGRLFRVQWLIYAVILAFIAVYLGLFFGLKGQ